MTKKKMNVSVLCDDNLDYSETGLFKSCIGCIILYVKKKMIFFIRCSASTKAQTLETSRDMLDRENFFSIYPRLN